MSTSVSIVGGSSPSSANTVISIATVVSVSDTLEMMMGTFGAAVAIASFRSLAVTTTVGMDALEASNSIEIVYDAEAERRRR